MIETPDGSRELVGRNSHCRPEWTSVLEGACVRRSPDSIRESLVSYFLRGFAVGVICVCIGAVFGLVLSFVGFGERQIGLISFGLMGAVTFVVSWEFRRPSKSGGGLMLFLQCACLGATGAVGAHVAPLAVCIAAIVFGFIGVVVQTYSRSFSSSRRGM